MMAALIGYMWAFLAGVSPGTALLAFVLGFLLFIYNFGGKKFSNPLPPAPGWRVPILGHLPLMKEDMRGSLRKFREQLGDVYSLYLGNKHLIVVSGYTAMKEMFVTHGEVYQDRHNVPLIALINRGKGFSGSNGEIWKRHRKFTISTLKDLGMGKSRLEDKLQEEAQRIITSFEGEVGNGFDPKPIIMTSVANMVCHLVFADGFKIGDPRIAELMIVINENFRYCAGVANYMPFPTYLPDCISKADTLRKNGNKMHQFIYDVIDDVVANDSERADSFVKSYLAEMEKQQQGDDPAIFSKEDLASCFLDLVAAGSESTTMALLWCIVCLVNHPTLNERMFTEITEQTGKDRLPSVLDRPKLPFVEAFINEVLRYCSIVLLGLVHCPTHDTVFRGFTIPKSAMIIPDMDSIGSDVTVWGDPETFRPDRFLDKDGKFLRKEENIQFFLGKRSCLGESLAKMELFLFLTSIVQRFELEPADGSDLRMANIDGVFGLSHGPKDFRINVKPRTGD